MKDVLILAGFSAAGKTVVMTDIMERDGRFTSIRSVTTRPPRGDAHDAEYIYLSEEEFVKKLEENALAENVLYAGHRYGTPKSELDRAHREGKIPLLVLDLNGVDSFAALSEYASCSIYIYEDLDVIEGRLHARFIGDTPTPEGERRYNARREQNLADALVLGNHAKNFYAFLKNSTSIQATADEVLKVFARFTEGVPADVAANIAVTDTLAASARAKGAK